MPNEFALKFARNPLFAKAPCPKWQFIAGPNNAEHNLGTKTPRPFFTIQEDWWQPCRRNQNSQSCGVFNSYPVSKSSWWTCGQVTGNHLKPSECEPEWFTEGPATGLSCNLSEPLPCGRGSSGSGELTRLPSYGPFPGPAGGRESTAPAGSSATRG